MKRKIAALLLLAATAGFEPAQAKSKKPSVPEEFQTAKTVFVEARDARDITDIKLDPADRRAILDLQDGIQDWGRYTLSRSRVDADLILVVYKGGLTRDPSSTGTLGSPRSSIGHTPIQDPSDASQSSQNPNSTGGLTEQKDELRVYTLQPNGKLKGPLWHDEQLRGLESPNLILLQRLKEEVEKAYPTTPAKQQTTP